MKIVIIEDEIRIRKGLGNLIKKISPDYEIVGEADNGKAGIQIVLQQNPDLIITDIQMPIMNGLEMLSYFYERQIMPKTVILSAYSEFSYAQQAIKFGVKEYLIKPIMIDELTNVLKSVEQQIKDKKENETIQIRSPQEIFDRVLKDQIVINDDLEQYALKNFSFNIQQEFALLLVYPSDPIYVKSSGSILNWLSAIRQEINESSQMITYKPLNSYLFIIPVEKERTVIEKILRKNIINRFQVNNEICFYLNFFNGISELKDCLAEIKKNMDWYIAFENEALIVIPMLNSLQTFPLTYPVIIEDQTKAAICMSNRKKLENGLKEFKNYFTRGYIYCPKEIKECYVRFIWAIISVAKGLDMVNEYSLNQQKILEKIMGAVNNKELQDTLNIIYLVFPHEEIEEQNMKLVIRRTKSLAHEFYSRGITLEEIAEKLNVTSEYLSAQFHKEVGVSFSSYMKDYRVQQAKKLLLGTNLKLYEIANQVGYSDPKHFSKVFREITGMLPGEYRKLNK